MRGSTLQEVVGGDGGTEADVAKGDAGKGDVGTEVGGVASEATGGHAGGEGGKGGTLDGSAGATQGKQQEQEKALLAQEAGPVPDPTPAVTGQWA